MRLVKILATAIWVFGVPLASAAYADPPSIVGRLNYLTGPVSFAPGEAPDHWGAAQLNRPITAGDRLWTDNGGFAELRVGSLGVRMAPQTSMDVLSLDDRAFQLRVAQGNVHLRVRRLPGDRLIEVATPTGAVVIRQPGSYRINVDSSGDFTIVSVRGGGQAEVFTADASLLVRDNQEAEISGFARPQLYAAPQPDEFDRWAADRDRRYDNIGSTRYVSAEMTGYEDLDYHGQWRTVGEYGNVWIPNSVSNNWAPYRQGHWVWISPWGWTWVDEQPWGFAPFHYGRWVWVNNYWAWAPGRIVERPVYSPALVAFIGGSSFSVGISAGPAVGWVPLGYREPYIPWYTASPTYVRNVNVTHVTNVTHITNVTSIRYVNRTVPNAVTVVPRETFVAARPVQREIVRVDNRRIAAAQILREAPVAQPVRTSFARSESGSRPPAQVIAREAVTVHKPAAPSRQIAVRDARDDQRAAKDGGSAKDDRRAPPVAAAAAQLPPVRVIERRQRVSVPVEQAPRAEARAARQVTQAPRAETPAEQQRQPQVVQERQRDLQTREQQGERLREQKKQETDQQKAQAIQQAEQLEREKKQRASQEQQRAQQERDQGQKAAQEQRNREEQQRAQQERERGQKAAQDQRQRQEDQQRAQQESERGQKAAQEQRQRQEQERSQREQQQQKAAQEERERGLKAAQERQRQEQERSQREQQQQKAAQEERERGQKAAQERAQREQQQRAQQEQQRQRQQAAQKAQQEQQRAQQEQQRQQQQAAQKAQQEQQAAQQQQKAAQEQQRQQQAAQQQAREQQRAQQEQQRQQQAAQQAARTQQPQEAEKAKRERGRKDRTAGKDKE